MSKVKEIYCSTDIEADGPIPGKYSMLSLACSAGRFKNGKLEVVDEFSRNLERLPGAEEHPDTMNFWSGFPDAYNATRIDTVDPEIAMKEFSEWLKGLPGKTILTTWPGGYDFMWVVWYLHYFTGSCPLGITEYNMKTAAKIALRHNRLSTVNKSNMPSKWFENAPKHSHIALDDAREQLMLFGEIESTLRSH